MATTDEPTSEEPTGPNGGSAGLPPAPEASFASDNAAGALPEVVEAVVEANRGSALAYGQDPWTARVERRFAELFGTEVGVALCWGGTGANVVALQCLLRPWEGVICTDVAHIHTDECGAPERVIGCKLLAVPAPDGRLGPADVAARVGEGVEHHVQARVVSLTQATESGTLYRPGQLAAVVAEAHRHGLLVHVDGARIANAAAALGVDLREMVTDTGVDVVTFGGTKDGMIGGEAVVFLRPELGRDVRFVRKQVGQLASKMRFVAAQFEALLADGRWLRAADHANAMATRLADRLRGRPGVALVREPEVNSVFVRVPPRAVRELQEWSFVWPWGDRPGEVRAMTSFATTEEDVDRFARGVEVIAARHLPGRAPGAV